MSCTLYYGFQLDFMKWRKLIHIFHLVTKMIIFLCFSSMCCRYYVKKRINQCLKVNVLAKTLLHQNNGNQSDHQQVLWVVIVKEMELILRYQHLKFLLWAKLIYQLKEEVGVKWISPMGSPKRWIYGKIKLIKTPLLKWR